MPGLMLETKRLMGMKPDEECLPAWPSDSEVVMHVCPRGLQVVNVVMHVCPHGLQVVNVVMHVCLRGPSGSECGDACLPAWAFR